MRPRSHPFNIPFRIFCLTALLATIGVVMVYSASANYVSVHKKTRIEKTQTVETSTVSDTNFGFHKPDLAVRQFIGVLLGFCAMFMAYKLDYNRLKSWSPWFVLLAIVLLILVFVPGVSAPQFGCYRWVRIGPLTVQPSEFAKLALIIYIARMLNNHHDKMGSLVHGVFPAMGVTAIFAILIVSQTDIGATAIIISIVLMMWFIGGMRIRHLTGLLATTICGLVFAVLERPDLVRRVLAFLHPNDESVMDKRHQLEQSLIAVGSGGLDGLGLGNSMQKHFLTEQFSDFIFAILSEETGFIGAGFVILLFFLLIWEGWRIALRAPDFYASLLASGITLMLAINVTLNLMVVLGMAPTKGLVLPLISAGGTSVIVTMASLGILMNIGAYIEQERQSLLSVAGEKRTAAAREKMRRQTKNRRKTRWAWG